MAATLTVANSSIAITVESLYPSSVLLSGYAADNVFETSAVVNKETSMGIDGKFSAGFVYNEIPFTLTLQADSPSLIIFEQIWQYEQTNRTGLDVGMTVTLPSNGKRYGLQNGYMTSFRAPSGQRTLQPAAIEFRFGRMTFART
ncbi:hypothetical protein [Xanthomonas phage NEB7]|nr:hypothetical protein [Xanthomonas phage NEB7]